MRRRGRKDIFLKIRRVMASNESSRVIWMHCASLGEFEQGRPVLDSLRAIYPGCGVILTFFSASGYEVQKNYPGANGIFYLPMDTPQNARHFLELVRPSLILWIKYEYWFHYLREANDRDIPVLLISGNFWKEQLFFRWYGGLYRRILPFFTHLFVQNKESKNLLSLLGHTNNVTVSGDTRFDRVVEIAGAGQPFQDIEAFCGNANVLVAGSTWEDDEEILSHFANTHPEIKFIIAPHEIGASHLESLQKLFKNSVFYSALKKESNREIPDQGAMYSEGTGQPHVLIIDNIGMLSRLYRHARIAYVGGGFGESGVHNVLEAAVYGIPVVIGPVYDRFIEARELVDCAGAISIENALELEQTLNVLLKNGQAYSEAGEAAGSYVSLRTGAREKITAFIGRHAWLSS